MSIGTVKDIDIADIDWVFQFNAPSCASDFIHRCGRTARIVEVNPYDSQQNDRALMDKADKATRAFVFTFTLTSNTNILFYFESKLTCVIHGRLAVSFGLLNTLPKISQVNN
ncbi:hypothetical protein DAPPUDRAFT_322752 [Daphnia pulex]|uniref:Helicase C-terminal domain-containing protein n=1 Tax=Daphnia pulex TaxID=6669 RepID=E9GWW7_DAPPU|nr:hypothetical protein DAPPUDRAFT_322752 [Daphnia pulex]|eukprot:EFX76044.1 hypothetical protein DAPPUDRAFT_322752 [Daphnia pulex]